MRKKIGIIVIIITVLAVGWKLYRDYKIDSTSVMPSNKRSVRTTSVEVTAVKNDIIKDIGRFTGSLFPNSHITISSKVSGRIEKIYFNAGEEVQKGDLIVKIEDYEYKYQLEQAKSDLEISQSNYYEAKSGLDIAKKEFYRAKDLFQKNIMSTAEYDNVENRYKIAESKYNAAKHQVDHRKSALKLAELRLSYTKIYAEWETDNRVRIIGQKFIDEGNIIAVNSPLVSILDNNYLKASIYVSEKDYLRINRNDRAIIINNMLPDLRLEGKVSIIEPFLKENIRQGRVEILFENKENLLKPGMFVNVMIEFDVNENATIVPYDSLVKRNEIEGIFLADEDNNLAKFIPVTTGIIQDNIIEIKKPENLKGCVITLGHHLVQDGASIYIANRK